MLHQNKVDRALDYQHEQAQNRDEEYDGRKLYEPTTEDLIEKGDMPALIFSALLTLVPISLAVLLVMVFLARLFFRIF
ncbi:MAG: hypothetical protein K6A40_06095 [Solobacterium sp.]|nr:hypothetical protein [Solobacterium sp.]